MRGTADERSADDGLVGGVLALAWRVPACGPAPGPPRTRPEPSADVDKAELACFDMALFSLRPAAGELPATPLPVRQRPVEVGEKVFLVGCPYAEPTCRQNVYVGKVSHCSEGPT